MIDVKYANAYKEVLEILKYISIEEYNKIPKIKIDIFEKYANKNYQFEYNPSLTLEEQNVSEGAQAIIGILFRDYWATAEQKEKILQVQEAERMKIQKQNEEKYNPDNLFKNKKHHTQNYENIISEEMSIVKYKERNFLEKLFDKIKHLFKRK